MYDAFNTASLWPNSFEKKKVNLVIDVFNEKVNAALKLYKHLDTALFIERVHRMWCIINVTYPDTGHHLNDEDRKPITSKSDDRLAFLEKMATGEFY